VANPIPFERLNTLRLRGGAAKTPKPPLMQLLRKLWRRKGLISATTFMLLLVATATVFMLTPLYTATTLVILEPEQKGVVDISAVVAGLPSDEGTIESETQVLLSRGLALKVVKQLSLDQVPEFNVTLKPRTWINDVADWTKANVVGAVQSYIQSMTGTQPPAQSTIDPQEAIQSGVLDIFVTRLAVSPIGRSRAINIQFTSENAQLAARVANTIAQLYIVERLDEKFESTRKVTEWLNSRIGELRRDVEGKQRAVDDFRRKADLLKGERGEALIAQEVSELNSTLAQGAVGSRRSGSAASAGAAAGRQWPGRIGGRRSRQPPHPEVAGGRIPHPGSGVGVQDQIRRQPSQDARRDRPVVRRPQGDRRRSRKGHQDPRKPGCGRPRP